MVNSVVLLGLVNSVDSLDHFISSTQNCSKPKNIKSKIKFEIDLSTNEVNLLDVTISLKHGKLKITLLTKPRDFHFYLNTSSCHPSHVLKNIPKAQFIRLGRICSRKLDYLLNNKISCKKLIERGFHEKELKKDNRSSGKNG